MRTGLLTIPILLTLPLIVPAFEMDLYAQADTSSAIDTATVVPDTAAAIPDTATVAVEEGLEIEVVQSAPIETELDRPEFRNTAEVWVEMLGRAQESLDMAEFYMSDKPDSVGGPLGSPLGPVIEAMIAAAGRGVSIRILAAKSMYETYPETIDLFRETPGVEVRLFDISEITGGVLHAKYFIIDRQEFFLGSQNFDWRSLEHIHELGLRVVSESLALTLGRIFETDWSFAGGFSPQVPEGEDKDSDGLADDVDPAPETATWNQKYGEDIRQAFLVASPPALNPPGILAAEAQLVGLISAAQQQIVIQLLSYSPTDGQGLFYPAIDNALRGAASRGVQIRIILSDWSKRHPMIEHLMSLEIIPNLKIRLSTIPQWSRGFIPYARVEHCKYMVIDREILWVGTSNWSKDYFHNSRNVEMVIVGDTLPKKVWKVFYDSWRGPYTYPLRVDIDYPPPRISK